jgi:TRAP-type C4-dicarboxylate transport system substrate-binding protein
LALWPLAAAAEPVTLKLAFGTSDQSISYRAAARPFVEAINSEGQGLIGIESHFSGALGDPRRTVTYPTVSDRSIADSIFQGVAASWAAEAPRNAEPLRAAREKISKIRQTR